MKNLLHVLCWTVLLHANVLACGYSFVGGCSSHIRLKINGTEGVFAIDPCNSETAFQGLQLGNIRSLALSGGSVITWESCINNVTAAAIYYRVYPAAQSGGNWSSVNIPEEYNTLEGPYTTRYRNATSNINLGNGLTVGGNYTLEIYVRAEIDTLGDDFIPETFILKNNNNANYKLQFTYGGMNAPALATVFTRQDNVLCWGKNTGFLGVSVFGTQPGGSLFYQWSAFSENFQQIDSLPAGTYTVTVTESPSGNTATRSVQVTQPQFPISVNFTNVTPATCTTPGSATIQPSGGTGTLTWEWGTGDTTQTAFFPNGGIYAITITDANACTQKGMINISGAGSVTIFELPVICQGEAHIRGGQSFSETGLYSVNVPAPNGCDTIVQFYLTVVGNSGSTLLNTIPAVGTVTCAQQSIDLCAATGAAAYTWTRNGQPLSTTGNCLSVQDDGVYQVSIQTVENGKTCTFSKTTEVTAHLNPPGITTDGSSAYVLPCYTGDVKVVVRATATESVSAYAWVYNGSAVSALDSCVLTVPPTATGILSVQVTDIYGCVGIVNNITVSLPQPIPPPVIFGATQQTNCDGTIDVALNVLGGLSPLTINWSSGTTGNPATLAPGFNNVEVTDAAGCTASVFVIVEEFAIATESTPATGATNANGSAKVDVNGAAALPVSYLWDNGATTPAISNLLPGTYCVTVTESGGCTRTACVEVEFSSGTTQPFFRGEGLSINPNPATVGSTIFIRPMDQNGVWELVNAQGKICDQRVLTGSETSLVLPDNLPEGVYIALIKTNKFLYTNKIFLKNKR